MIAYMFPGQGSQYKGMGKELFEIYSPIVEEANNVLGYDVKALCLEDPYEQLNQTEYTQPALFVVNALYYESEKQKKQRPPDFLLGHSLGEYNALYAAGAFDFSTGLQLVQKRAKLMGSIIGGGMAVIVGLKSNDVTTILEDNNLNTLSISNFNTPLQNVIAGPKADIIKARKIFEEARVELYLLLNVSGAFHSQHMKPIAENFQIFLEEREFLPLLFTVIANVNAEPYVHSKIPELLSSQISLPVRWSESITYLINNKVKDFIELGNRGILKGMVQNIINSRSS